MTFRYFSSIPDNYRSLIRHLCWTSVWIVLGLFHLKSIRAPFITRDDCALADYAYHDRLQLWENSITASEKRITNSYAWGLFIAHERLQGAILRRFGVGVVQSRAGPLLASWLGIGVLIIVVTRMRLPSLCMFGLMGYGTSLLFFQAMHSFRPEGFVFLTMAINIYWLFSGKNRLMALISGALASGMLVFHQASLFFLIVFPWVCLLYDGTNIFKNPRYIWWVLGASGGLLYAVHIVDMDNAMQYFQLTNHTNVTIPPLFQFHGNPWLILERGWLFQARNLALLQDNPINTILMNCMGAATLWQLRRFRQLDPPERVFLGMTLMMFVATAACNGSAQSNYLIYLYPWLWMQLLMVLGKMLAREYGLDSTDLLLLSVVTLPLYFANPTLDWTLLLLPMYVRWMIPNTETSRFVSLMTLVYLLLLCVTEFEFLICLFIWVKRMIVHNHALQLVGVLIISLSCAWVKISQGNMVLAGIRFPIRKILLFIFSIVLSLHVLFDAKAIINQWKATARAEADLELFIRLYHPRCLAGPEFLWVYDPTLVVLSTSVVEFGDRYHIPILFWSRIYEMRPTYLILPMNATPTWLTKRGKWKGLITMVESGRLIIDTTYTIFQLSYT